MARHEITLRRVVYEIPGMEAVTVVRDVEYARSHASPLTMDVYYPSAPNRDLRRPAVIIVGGYADVGVPLTLGCVSKEMEMVISWAQLIAASGMVAVAYTKADPAGDAHTLVQYIRQHDASLGIDASRIGLWAASGNVPVALSLLMQPSGNIARCAVLCYGFMLDLDGTTHVAEAAKTWGFGNPCAGRSVDDLQRDVALFIARAGGDHFPGLNECLDRFVCQALARDLPVTVVNHARAPHAFDLVDATDDSRNVVRQILGFLQFQLRSS